MIDQGQWKGAVGLLSILSLYESLAGKDRSYVLKSNNFFFSYLGFSFSF